MKTFVLKILTPERTAFDGTAERLTVTDTKGLVSVLSGHAPMVAVLAPGPLQIALPGGAVRHGMASGGILHVTREETAVLIDSFEWEEGSKDMPGPGNSET